MPTANGVADLQLRSSTPFSQASRIGSPRSFCRWLRDHVRNNAGEHSQIPVTYTFLDSPNTASSVAYKVQVTKGSDSGYVTINKTYSATDERANVASAMQVMEISS